jgi:hypothetical protein
METLITKKIKIGELIMSNSIAPNNGLVCVTLICSSKWKLAALLEKIYSTPIILTVISRELKWVHRHHPFGRWIHHN